MLMDNDFGLMHRFLRGFRDFLYFWYIKSSRDFWRSEISFIKGVERDIGVMINLKLVTQPIFGDYSYIGRVIGPIFRLGRVIFGLIAISFSAALVTAIYLFWIFLPPVAAVMTVENLVYMLSN